MHCCSAHATVAMPFVERDGEQDIRRLGSAVGDERVLRSALEVGIMQVDIRETMALRREIDNSASFADKWRNADYQDKVAQQIRAELRFKSV
jgi:hypothetical protein